jgi:hypothetical protein
VATNQSQSANLPSSRDLGGPDPVRALRCGYAAAWRRCSDMVKIGRPRRSNLHRRLSVHTFTFVCFGTLRNQKTAPLKELRPDGRYNRVVAAMTGIVPMTGKARRRRLDS